MTGAKMSFPQKRAALVRLGLSRTVIDDLEMWTEAGEMTRGRHDIHCTLICPDDLDRIAQKLDKSILSEAEGPIREIRETMSFANALGLSYPLVLRPLMVGPTSLFSHGIYFEISRRTKRSDTLAQGGR